LPTDEKPRPLTCLFACIPIAIFPANRLEKQ
jgi:hypothetical protein